MEYFRLEHPLDRLILCNRSGCEDIADYLEVKEQGREDFVCAAHTSSEMHASVLPKGVPSAEPHRSRPAPTPISPSTPIIELQEQINLRAYELYEQRGREDGHDVKDWLQAEAEVRQRSAKKAAA